MRLCCHRNRDSLTSSSSSVEDWEVRSEWLFVFLQRIGDDFLTDLHQLKNILKFINNDVFIRDIARIKKVPVRPSVHDNL